MAFPIRTKSDVLKDVLTELRNTGVNNLAPGSKGRALAAVFSKEIETVYNFFDSNFDAAYLANASGSLLEALGSLFGVRRKQAQKAYSFLSEQNLTFYTEDGGTFGSINSGGDIVIPAGTIISAPVSFSNSASIDFQVLVETTLPAASTVGFVSVEGLLEGSINNAGARTLISHDFTSYTQASNSTLKVINRYAVVNGAEREPDSLYRARLSTAATALQRGNFAALRFSLLSVPGVVDIHLLRYFDGIGSVGAFVTGQNNETPPSLLSQCQLSLDSFASYGEVVTAYAPNKLGLSFTTHVNLSREVTATEQSQIRRKLINRTYQYIAELAIGDSVDLENLAIVLQRTDNSIVNLGLTPSTTQFDELYIYRYSEASTSRVRKTILNTTTTIGAENYEIFIGESSVASPFTFTFDAIV